MSNFAPGTWAKVHPTNGAGVFEGCDFETLKSIRGVGVLTGRCRPVPKNERVFIISKLLNENPESRSSGACYVLVPRLCLLGWIWSIYLVEEI